MKMLEYKNTSNPPPPPPPSPLHPPPPLPHPPPPPHSPPPPPQTPHPIICLKFYLSFCGQQLTADVRISKNIKITNGMNVFPLLLWHCNIFYRLLLKILTLGPLLITHNYGGQYYDVCHYIHLFTVTMMNQRRRAQGTNFT